MNDFLGVGPAIDIDPYLSALSADELYKWAVDWVTMWNNVGMVHMAAETRSIYDYYLSLLVEWPKIVNGWEAYDDWEVHLLTDFGTREDIDTYLSTKTKTEIINWFNAWAKMFGDAQRDVPTRTIYDRMIPILHDFYDEYYPYAS